VAFKVRRTVVAFSSAKPVSVATGPVTPNGISAIKRLMRSRKPQIHHRLKAA
jgi:hypothetical protein